MKAFCFIVAVALLSLVNPSAGIGVDLGIISGGIELGGLLGSSDAESGVPNAYYAVGFMATKSNYCIQLARLTAYRKQKAPCLLGILCLSSASEVIVGFDAKVWYNNAYQLTQCSATVGYEGTAQYMKKYDCNPRYFQAFDASYQKK